MMRVQRVSLPPRAAMMLHGTIAVIAFSFALASVGNAQLKRPADEDHGFTLGIEAGNGWHRQNGTFNDACGCVVDDGAAGSGFVGSVLFEMPGFNGLVFGIRTGLDFKNATETTHITDRAVVSQPDVRDTGFALVGLSIDRISSYKLTYFFVAPYLHYQFLQEGAFVQVGPSFSFLMANHLNQTRQLTSQTDTINGQAYSNLRFQSSGTNKEVIEDGDIPNVNSLRVSALLSTGWNINLWGFTVAPMVSYDFPFTTVRDQNATGWKISSLYATVALKVGL